MTIFRTNNPLQYAEVDGIVIDEQAPAPNVRGVGTGVAILVGQFQRGSKDLTRVSSIKDFHQKYAKSSYIGNIQLKNKKFSALKIIRVVAQNAAIAQEDFRDVGDLVNVMSVRAKHFGVYGKKIKVKIEDGSVSGKKVTIQDDDAENQEFFPIDIYDNLDFSITDLALKTAYFKDSKIADVSVTNAGILADTVGFEYLKLGSDGTIADTDYEDAIKKAEAQGAGNILFLDEYNEDRNLMLKTHAGLTQDKIVICAPLIGTTVSTAISNVALLRDTDGRIVYAFNWVETLIDGQRVLTSPASWYASILSQTAPNIDPAFVGNSQFLFGVTKLEQELTRDDFIQLNESGISSFEFDSDFGFKIKSGIVTQIANSSKITVLRRRMADFLTDSIAKFLKNYQNAVNSRANRLAAKAAILRFITQQEQLGILPGDNEVQNGFAKIVDIDSENTNDTLAEGKFFIVYKQRIFSSMRFIVLKAEIGESVVVSEGE